MNIQLFTTGGTFDKEYNEIEEVLYFTETHLPEMLKRGRSKLDISVKSLMAIDSLDMTQADRNLILDACKKTKAEHIVITHGTGTMVETATTIARSIDKNKVVVLTGAMHPYAFGSSDGLFNLGSAVSFAQTLPPGVYIAMNGRYFNWDNCVKNVETGIFEEIR